MTFWILLTMAGFLTYLSLKYYNFWLSATGMLAWFIVWGYNLDHPPTNITKDMFVYDILFYMFILLAIGTFFMYFRNRNRLPSGYVRTAQEQAEYEREYKEATSKPANSYEEYRLRVHNALHPHSRRG